MQVDPIEPTLKAPGTERLKLKCEILLPTSAFKLTRAGTAGCDSRQAAAAESFLRLCHTTAPAGPDGAPAEGIVGRLESGGAAGGAVATVAGMLQCPGGGVAVVGRFRLNL